VRFHFFFLMFFVVDILVVSSLAEILQIGLMRIDLLIPGLCWYGLMSSLPEGIFSVLAAGSFMDCVSGVGFGLYTSSLPAAYLLVRYIASNARMDLWWQKTVMVLLASFVFQAMARIFSGYVDTIWPWGAVQAVSDGLVAIFLFPALNSILPLIKVRGHA